MNKKQFLTKAKQEATDNGKHNLKSARLEIVDGQQCADIVIRYDAGEYKTYIRQYIYERDLK